MRASDVRFDARSRAEKTLPFLAEHIMLYMPDDFGLIVEPGNYYQITRLASVSAWHNSRCGRGDYAD